MSDYIALTINSNAGASLAQSARGDAVWAFKLGGKVLPLYPPPAPPLFVEFTGSPVRTNAVEIGRETVGTAMVENEYSFAPQRASVAAGTAVAARYVAGMSWHLALLVGTAVAATDPAVVFSVFGRREIAGRTGVLLEGESGANDPVGIALLSSLLAAHGGAGSVVWHVVAEFALQMAVGVAVGVAGGLALLAFMRRVPLPSEGLYSPRVLAGVLAIFGAATVAQGSGFLAVLVAGIIIGDEPAPYKREIERFHSSLASLAEIVA